MCMFIRYLTRFIVMSPGPGIRAVWSSWNELAESFFLVSFLEEFMNFLYLKIIGQIHRGWTSWKGVCVCVIIYVDIYIYQYI